MARMLPAQIYTGNPSLGEKEIFRRLRDDPNTKDWIVLHSLDIAEHVKKLAGEADFVVIVPEKGVLCLEVKGTRKVRREKGLWYYGSDPTPDTRGPFKQSSQAMHSIRQKVFHRDSKLGNVIFWSAVIFPYVPFNIKSGEWHHWQVIDSHNFRRKSIGSVIVSVLNQAREFAEKRKAIWFDPSSSTPDRKECQLIAEILRPDFELYEPPRNKVERLEAEVKKYTHEQFIALDVMQNNPRVIFTGPAGTGKTLLAIEAVARSCSVGKRVLFLCYNSLLAKYLELKVSTVGTNIVVGTLHSHMLRIAGVNVANYRDTSSFWESVLPELASDKLLEHDTDDELFDMVVIDEAQDLMRQSYLDFIDLSLKGGLSAGNWLMFGDFERQAIYDSASDIELANAIESRFGNPAQYSLRTNCRNTPRIAALVHVLSELTPEYHRILRPDDQSDPKIAYYSDDSQQQHKISQIISELKSYGFKNSEIVILSMKADGIASKIGMINDVKLKPISEQSQKSIGYSSIHGFKGMENHAVIVTDVTAITNMRDQALLYVAMTRALHKLHIVAHTGVRQAVADTILNN